MVLAQKLSSGIVEGLCSTDNWRPMIAEAPAVTTTGKEYNDQHVLLLMGCNGATYYISIDKGLTLLMCRPPKGEEIEALHICELHKSQTVATRTLADLLGVALVKTKPAEDNNELKLNLGTFCTLLWTLFGSKCDYYKKCFLIWTALDDDTVFANRRYFSPLLCCHMSWAIIKDGRKYFSKVMTKPYFVVLDEGYDIIFPWSHLDSMADSAYMQTAIACPSFLTEWTAGWLSSAAKEKGAVAPTYSKTQPTTAKMGATTTPWQVSSQQSQLSLA